MAKKKRKIKKDRTRGLLPAELESSSELIFWLKVAVGLSLLLFLLIISPFMGKGIFSGHDILSHLIYLRKFEDAVFAGQLPVRWIDWFTPGFNHPLFNFYQPGFYYLFLLPRAVFGLSNTASLLFLVPLLWLLSALFMFLFVRRHFGNLAGVLASLFYTFAPYHIADVFVRAALTEFTALAFIPGFFWAVKSFWDTGKGYYLFLTAAFLGLIILSHPPTLIMFSPLIVLYIGYLFWLNTDSRRLKADFRRGFRTMVKSDVTVGRRVKIADHPLGGGRLNPELVEGGSHDSPEVKWQRKPVVFLLLTLFSLLVGLGMIAFFLLPAFFEQQYVQAIFMRAGYYDFHIHFVCWPQLFVPKWDYGLSLPGCSDGMAYQLGLAHWLVVVAVFYFLLRRPVSKIVQSSKFKVQSYNSKKADHHLGGGNRVQSAKCKVQSYSSKLKVSESHLEGDRGKSSRQFDSGVALRAPQNDEETMSFRQATEYTFLTLIMLAVFFSSLYLMFSASLPFWETLPYLPFVQYPWRFLAVAIFTTAFLAGALLTFFKKDIYRYGVYLGLVGILALIYLPYLHPSRYFSRMELNFDDPRFLAGVPPQSGNLRPEVGYLPIWADVLPAYENSPVEEVKTLRGTVKLEQSNLAAARKEYRLRAEEESEVRFFTHYFPGWKVLVDNRDAQFSYDNIYGYIDVELPSGEHKVELIFQDTPVRKLGNIVSVVAFLVGLGLVFIV